MFFKLLYPGAILPQQTHPTDVGWDVMTPMHVSLPVGKLVRVPLGLAWQPKPGLHAIMKEKSGLAAKGMHILGGVIDGDYRGEWQVILYNSGPQTLYFDAGMKIAQFIVIQGIVETVENVEELNLTNRGEGGFGSTGR